MALDWLVLSSPLLQLQLYAVETRWSTRAPTTTWSRPTATCPTRTGCSCPRPWATLARDPSPWQCRRVRSPHGDPTTCSPWTVWPMPWWIWMSRWYSDLIKHLDGGRYFSMSRNYEQLKDILLWIAGWKRTTSTASTTLDSGTTAENPLIQIIYVTILSIFLTILFNKIILQLSYVLICLLGSLRKKLFVKQSQYSYDNGISKRSGANCTLCEVMSNLIEAFVS